MIQFGPCFPPAWIVKGRTSLGDKSLRSHHNNNSELSRAARKISPIVFVSNHW